MSAAPANLDFGTAWRQGVDTMKKQDQVPGFFCVANCCIGGPAAITLFVMGILGAAGVMSASTLGICAVGLGAGTYVLSLPSLRGRTLLKQFIIGGLAAAAIISVGALGISGVLSAQVIGWSILGAFAGQAVLSTCANCCDSEKHKSEKRKQAKEDLGNARRQWHEGMAQIREGRAQIREGLTQIRAERNQ